MSLRFKVTALALLLISALVSAQGINASATVQLTGPASPEQINSAKQIAKGSLKADLARWLSTKNIKIDTANALKKFHMDMLADTFLNHSKSESSYRGKELTILYALDEASAEQALTAFNSAVQNSAIQSWTNASSALKNNAMSEYFSALVKTYSYATAYIGQAIATPGASTNLSDDAQMQLQTFFKRIKIQSSDMIIQGKIGRPAVQPPTVTVLLDSVPFPNLYFSGSLQNSKLALDSYSDANGKVSLNNLIIPLVPNGTLFYLTPDLGKTLGTSSIIIPKDLKIQLNDGQIQSFMFKVSRPTYTLVFKIASDSSAKVPVDFSSSAPVKKYLYDSCYFSEAPAGIPPDFMITLEGKISTTDTDITEERGLKLSATLEIKGLSLETPKTETAKIEYVKHIEKQLDVPYGLFLWDVNNVYKQNIRSVLNKL